MNLHKFTNISKILQKETVAQFFKGYPFSKVYVDFVLLLSQWGQKRRLYTIFFLESPLFCL